MSIQKQIEAMFAVSRDTETKNMITLVSEATVPREVYNQLSENLQGKIDNLAHLCMEKDKKIEELHNAITVQQDLLDEKDELGEESWCCWPLSKEDIDIVYAKRLKGDYDIELSNDHYIDVLRVFKKAFEYNNDNWQEILEGAIEEVIK